MFLMPLKFVLCRGVLSSLKEANEKPIGGGRSGFSLESESSNDELGIGGGDVSSFGRPCYDYSTGSVLHSDQPCCSPFRCFGNYAGGQGDDNGTNDDGDNSSGINGELNAGEAEEIEDAFATLSAGGGVGAQMRSDGETQSAGAADGSGTGGAVGAGGGLDASFSALDAGTVLHLSWPLIDHCSLWHFTVCVDDDGDGWANFGDDGAGGDGFGVSEADPPPQPAALGTDAGSSSTADDARGESAKATEAPSADLDAPFEVNFDDAAMDEPAAAPAAQNVEQSSTEAS